MFWHLLLSFLSPLATFCLSLLHDRRDQEIPDQITLSGLCPVLVTHLFTIERWSSAHQGGLK